MSVWRGLADAFRRTAHRHRWSKTWVFDEGGHMCWRACACGKREERRVPTMEWLWRNNLVSNQR